MKLFNFILIFFTAKILLIFAAVPIDQFVMNRFYCKKNLELLDCAGRLQRKNKTAQEFKGWWIFKKPVTNEMSYKLIVSYQDYSGKWKGLFTRTFDKACDHSQMFKDQYKRYIPNLDMTCPMKAGNYTMGPRIVNRYRKDWDADMKFWIPPLFMEADNWKLEAIFYDAKFTEKAPLGHFNAEFRLLNDRMSQ